MLRHACSLLLLASCGGGSSLPDAGTDSATDAPSDSASPYPPECENLNPTHCLLPWPSSFYLASDPSTATGFRLQLPVAAMPANKRHIRVDTTQFQRFDGFSPATSIMTSYPGQVDPATLSGEDHIDDSLGTSATTIILDASGYQVAHYAELDEWPETIPERAPLYLRPAMRLHEGSRYLVAIRNLRYRDGTAVAPSDYFRALRDNTPLPGSDIEARRAHFEEIFGMLTAAGIERSSLIEAWDFVTASGETAWGEALRMRDDALGAQGAEAASRVGLRGLGCTVNRVDEMPDADVWRRVSGTVTVPLYLEGDGVVTAQARTHRDAQGHAAFNGMAEVPFEVQIPMNLYNRVRAGEAPGRLEVYGHGLFGALTEVEAGWHIDHQQRLNVVSVAFDWWGMSESDLGRLLLTLQEFSDFYATGERLQQAAINFLTGARSFRGVCSELAELQIPLDSGSTAPAIDTSAAYYYGNSQGGIMGGVVAGLATDIDRFVLGVTGMSYPLMVKRSVDWVTYSAVMANGYGDPLERDLLMVVSASLWDLAEPATFASHIIQDPLPGTPSHRVLMQVGVGDAQVPNVAAQLEARTIGVPYLTPCPIMPWGLTSSVAPLESALVVYQIPGAAPSLLGTRRPVSDTPAHEGVRRSTAAMDQIDAFFAPAGTITQTCDGICDPI